ncbi:hypothetical protein MKW94_000383 [Papaver nudicaule]|uniref:Myb-like domain-containing protein n=1 Tax=Papaver nudicaule TaxID=74823 RepID=A0AA41SL04_PAPNU|nr:hypothetical protein [Papaver nudicaule]
MSFTDLCEEISPTGSNNLLENNHSFTNCCTNFDSISPHNVANQEWFCSRGRDDGIGVENHPWPHSETSQELEMDSQLRVSLNPKCSLWEIVSSLQDTVHNCTGEPNVSPIEEVCVETTHSDLADKVLIHESGSDAAGNQNVDDELIHEFDAGNENVDECFCRKRKREMHDELKGHFEDLVNKMMNKQEDMCKVLLETVERKEKGRFEDLVNKMMNKQEDMCKVLLETIEHKEKCHFEDLVDKMTKKQDDMYKALLEKIEHKEKDMITREETWMRNVESERMRKEEERRGKFFGQPEIYNPEPLRQQAPQSTGQQIIDIPQSPEVSRDEIILHDQSYQQKLRLEGPEHMLDGYIKRWPKHEVLTLISLRAAREQKLPTSAPSIPVWEEISLGMASMGFSRTAKKCKEKWENINKYFKRAGSSGKKRSENSKTCQYFHELEMLYKKRLVCPDKVPEAVKEVSQGNSSNGETLATSAQVCDRISMSEPLLVPAVGLSGSSTDLS